MPPTLVVLAGPPLPGRWSLARALQRTISVRRFSTDGGVLPAADIAHAFDAGEWVLLDGDLATVAERRAALALARQARLLVEWHCRREEAEREVFRRYASRPEVLARAEFGRYLVDAQRREPVAGELPEAEVVRVGPELTLDAQVARVTAALHEPPPPPPARGRRRVMVVEDDADERAMLAEVLAELGVEVELAPDAGVALALLDDGADVDLLISDQQMPGMTGVELSRTLARRHPHVRTVLLTAYGVEETCRAAVRAQAVTVLSKPLRVMDLERVLDEAQP